MKRTLSLIFLSLITFSLTACNTMAGVGEDLQEAGEEIEEEAED
jgi:entericidin A